MRRASTGTVAAASAACTTVPGLADGSPGEAVLGAGLAWTVGNRPDGLVGETPVPDIAGRLVPGGKPTEAGELGMAVFAATTTSDAVPVNDRAPEAVASAEMRTCPPTVAADRTGTLTWSSAAWPTGSVPTGHAALFGSGHTVNFGAPTNRPPPVLARTDTARLVAFVDQTQMTNVASWPGLTSPAPERGWIRTHSCGVTFLGFGLGELGFGLGELDVGLGFGVGVAVELGVVVELGVGVVVAEVDDEALDEDEEVAGGEDVVGLDEGLTLSDLSDDADVLADADLLVLVVTDLAVVADEFADLSGDTDELASAAAGPLLAASVVADASFVLFGMSGHDAELMID